MQKVYLMAACNGVAQCLLKLDDIEGVGDLNINKFLADCMIGTTLVRRGAYRLPSLSALSYKTYLR